ncbi:MAG: hybrid sensor histidine kinase/response regulator [Gemmatimonadetes bacterium]|nr:MAG: hybrid sensor histidine kinase/response regulator [Gemmatimonadota bacterium]
MTTASPLRILLVEDNPGDVLLIQETLGDRQGEFALESVERLAAALERLRTGGIHVVLLDLTLPDSAGLGTFTAVRTNAPDVPIVVLTGLSDEALAVATVRDGAQDYLVKGQVDGNLLGRTIRYAFERNQVRRQLETSERQLRESEVGYRTLVERAPVGIYRSSAEGKFLSVNAALVRMLGYDSPEDVQQLDMACDVYADPAERQRLLDRDSYTEREYDEVEATWKRKDGLLLKVQLSVRAVRNVASGVAYYETIVRDVTEQRRLQAQLMQAQKMEAVGRLAGGVAHDFNNLLTVIISYSDLLLEDLGRDDPKREDVAAVRKAAEGAAALTHQLLAFSRQQVLQPKVLDVNATVANTEKLLRRLIGEDIQLVAKLGSGLGSVKADPGQIEQVIMNLAVNARDAMPAGGQLTIETANVEMDEAYVRGHPLAQPGRYVMLAVSDTGTGMDEQTKAHIFEPFFTTKELGKGTGLGLATVYGIVKQSGGFIWLYSEPGHGTSFKIYMPRVDESAERATPAAAAPLPRGTETILVVEDAPAVRAVTRQVLERQGYTVLEAPNGGAALVLATKHHGPIHLLLTDVVMPGVNGRQLAEQLARPRPDMMVLFTSGYTDDSVVRHGVLESGIAYLQKPFTPDGVARKVREVLDSSRDSGRGPLRP